MGVSCRHSVFRVDRIYIALKPLRFTRWMDIKYPLFPLPLSLPPIIIILATATGIVSFFSKTRTAREREIFSFLFLFCRNRTCLWNIAKFIANVHGITRQSCSIDVYQRDDIKQYLQLPSRNLVKCWNRRQRTLSIIFFKIKREIWRYRKTYISFWKIEIYVFKIKSNYIIINYKLYIKAISLY